MKKMPRLARASAMIILALALARSFRLSTPEPIYQGQPASYWLDSWGTNIEAVDAAFKAMGSNASPFLIKTLERKSSKLGEVVD